MGLNKVISDGPTVYGEDFHLGHPPGDIFWIEAKTHPGMFSGLTKRVLAGTYWPHKADFTSQFGGNAW